MSLELQTVINFCLQYAEDAPVRERVALYRGLAEFCGTPKMSAQLCSLADELEAADRNLRQFALQLEVGGAK